MMEMEEYKQRNYIRNDGREDERRNKNKEMHIRVDRREDKRRNQNKDIHKE